jgi:hypothetical protein
MPSKIGPYKFVIPITKLQAEFKNPKLIIFISKI